MLCIWQRRMSTKPSKSDYASRVAYSTENCVNVPVKIHCLAHLLFVKALILMQMHPFNMPHELYELRRSLIVGFRWWER